MEEAQGRRFAGPADASGEVLDRAELVAGLPELPARERQILVLFYLQDLSLETARRSVPSRSGRSSHGSTGRRRLLREHLTGKDTGDEPR